MVICWLMAITYAVAYLIAGNLVDLINDRFPNYVFWLEAIGLVSFGVSWLTASRTLPFLANPKERFRIPEGRAPDDSTT